MLFSSIFSHVHLNKGNRTVYCKVECTRKSLKFADLILIFWEGWGWHRWRKSQQPPKTRDHVVATHGFKITWWICNFCCFACVFFWWLENWVGWFSFETFLEKKHAGYLCKCPCHLARLGIFKGVGLPILRGALKQVDLGIFFDTWLAKRWIWPSDFTIMERSDSNLKLNQWRLLDTDSVCSEIKQLRIIFPEPQHLMGSLGIARDIDIWMPLKPVTKWRFWGHTNFRSNKTCQFNGWCLSFLIWGSPTFLRVKILWPKTTNASDSKEAFGWTMFFLSQI